MTTVTLKIQVDKSGASEGIGAVKRDLDGMGQAGAAGGQQAAGGINTMRSAIDGAKSAVAAFLAVYAGIQALSGVVRLADEYQGLSDRLRLATGSSAEFAAAQAGVFAIAQQTGSALGAVTDLYVGLSRSTEQLGLNQGELLTITTAINQSFAVSGTNAASAEAATRQLGQAFASGVLRGDEFNSMMENAPGLASALATSLGVTTGELRRMAAEGELTSEVLATGLLQQAPAIAAQFDQMGLTVGRAFTQLSNAVLQFVGEASQASGAGAALAAGISAVANNIDVLARALGALAVAVGVFYGARALGGMAVLFQGIATSIALTAAPIGAFITGATGAAAATGTWAVAARGLFTLMGGWVGILAGVAAGVYYLATAQTEAEETADAAEAAVNRLRTATGDLKPAALEAASATLTLAEAQLQSAIASLEAAEAYSRSAAGSLQYQGNLDGQARSAQGARDQVNSLASSVLALRGEIAAANGLDPIVTLQDLGVIDAANNIMGAFGISIGGVGRAALDAVPPAARLTVITAEMRREMNDGKKVAEQAARASAELTEEQERLAAEMGGPAVAAAIELAQRLRAVGEREQALAAANQLSASAVEQLRLVRAGLIASYQQQVTTMQALENPYQAYLRKLEDERRLLGMTATERARAESQIRATTAVMTYANQQRERGNGLLIEEIEALILQEQALDASAEATQRAAQEAQAWQQYWEGATDAVMSSFADLFSGGIDSMEEFGDQMLRISQQIVSDIIKEFARTGQIRLPGSDGTTGGNIAAGVQGLGLAYGGFQNAAAGGNPLMTVGSFALAGAQIGSIFPGIGNVIGAAVGAVVGVLVEAFGNQNETILRVRSEQFNGERLARGTATSALGDIFVRGESLGDGAAVEIAQSIAEFDNLIAGFLSPDQLALVRERLSNVNDTFRDGAATLGAAVNERLGAIVSVLDSNIQDFVGTTGTLEDRVARLVDALTISSIAATGVISNDFDEVANLLTRFRDGNEALSDTFLRLASGASLVNDAMLMLGTVFTGTQLQAATFAGELIELAGGLDQFSTRLSGALETLFSEDERNQFLADQAQAALNASLTGLNITGTGLESIRTQLRDQLRAAMEAGNAELTNQILIAANALGAFSTALEALGEDALAEANALAFGGTTLTPGGGGLTGPAGTAGGGAAPVQTQLQASTAAARSLELHTGLLQQIADNTRPGVDPAGEKSAREGSDADRAAAAMLREIKALIEAAVRNQTQEGIKSTTGANKRGAPA